MATYRIEDTTLQGIADKIRSKTGKTGAIPVTDFETEIESITTAPETDGKDVPETIGQRACLARATQFRDIRYTPVASLPYGSGTLPAGVEVTGLPYSSTRITDKFIGFNVSLHTFMTALHNPKSVLYSKRVEGISNASTWYGTNCSTYVSYALDLPYHSATNIIPLLPGMNEITDYTDLKLCDVVNCHPNFGNGGVNHATIITGITRNADGSIDEVTVSESLGNQKIMSTVYKYADWYNLYIVTARYKVYRYEKLYETSYQYSKYVQVLKGEDHEDDVINYSDLCTDLGDKATIRTDESITLNPLVTNGYTAIELYKDGELINTYDVKDVELSGLSAGSYTAVMIPSNGNSSTHFIVCEVSASKNGSKVRFSSAGATPARVVFKDAKGITKEVAELTEDDVLKGYKEVHPTNTDITSVCVPFKNEYGFVTVTSEWDVNTIPDEYESVEYIKTDGNQYIDTGVNAKDYPDGLTYTASFEITGVSNDKAHYLWGAMNNGIRAGNFAWSYNASNPANSTATLYTGDKSSGIPRYVNLMNVKSAVVAKARGNGGYSEYTLNGVVAGTYVDSSIAPDKTIALFWCNGLGDTSTSKKFIGKLYSFRIDTNSGVTLRNFKPVRHKADGVLGLYDTMNGVFYENKGTGSFTTEGDIPPDEPLIPAEYTQLQYIKTDGNQYIDTLVNATDHVDGIKYEFSGQALGFTNTSGNNYVWGALASSLRSGNLTFSPNGQKMAFMCGGAGTALIKRDGLPEIGSDFIITTNAITAKRADSMEAWFNGEAFVKDTGTAANGNMPNTTIYLLSASGVAATNGKFYGKLYSFVMKNPDDSLIRNFIPVKRNSDGVVGFYDTVTKTLFTNAGTGAFVAGPVA